MRHYTPLLVFMLLCYGFIYPQNQEPHLLSGTLGIFNSAGGDIYSNEGSVAYSFGTVFCIELEASVLTISQGIQHPEEYVSGKQLPGDGDSEDRNPNEDSIEEESAEDNTPQEDSIGDGDPQDNNPNGDSIEEESAEDNTPQEDSVGNGGPQDNNPNGDSTEEESAEDNTSQEDSIGDGDRRDENAEDNHIGDESVDGEKLNENSKDDNMNIVVFPNPTTSFVVVDMKKFENDFAYYELFDHFGRKLESKLINRRIVTVSLSQHSSSVYLLNVITKDKTKTFKLIKN